MAAPLVSIVRIGRRQFVWTVDDIASRHASWGGTARNRWQAARAARQVLMTDRHVESRTLSA